MRDSRRLVRILLLVMIVQISLLASHQGEFWPFSIYPMFSKAGREWTRVVVRDVSGLTADGCRCVTQSSIHLDRGRAEFA